MAITSQHQHAIETLHERGARFVLLRKPDTPEEKKPARNGWLDRKRPCLQAVTEHLNDGFNLGFVPWSLGLTGIDFDDGDRSQLMALPHRVSLPTQSGGVHIIFDDSRPRKNNSRKLHAFSAMFDVRGCNGYLMFHFDGAVRLADAMETGTPAPLPTDLFEAAGVELPVHGQPPKPRKKVRTGPSGSKTESLSSPVCCFAGVPKNKVDRSVEKLQVQDVRCGQRNNWLFAQVTRAIMAMSDTADAVPFALNLNAKLSDPLDVTEVHQLARSAIGYQELYRTSQAAGQNLRSRNAAHAAIAKRYGHAGPDIVAELASRDARMRRERAEGIPVATIQKRTNITKRQVRHITAGCRPAKAEPWKEHGISQRTWYRRKAEARAADKAAAEAAASKVEHHKPDPTETSALDAALATLQRQVKARNASPVVDLSADDAGDYPRTPPQKPPIKEKTDG